MHRSKKTGTQLLRSYKRIGVYTRITTMALTRWMNKGKRSTRWLDATQT